VLVFVVATSVQGAKSVAAASPPQEQQSQQPAPTIASTVDREISNIEKEIVELPRLCQKISSTSLPRA
jgi:hypothetical protein